MEAQQGRSSRRLKGGLQAADDGEYSLDYHLDQYLALLQCLFQSSIYLSLMNRNHILFFK